MSQYAKFFNENDQEIEGHLREFPQPFLHQFFVLKQKHAYYKMKNGITKLSYIFSHNIIILDEKDNKHN